MTRFVGTGVLADRVCPACREVSREILVLACRACLSRVDDGAEPSFRTEGQPGVLERPSLQTTVETLSLDERPASPIVAVDAARAAGRAWIAVTADGTVGRLDLVRREFRALARAPEGLLAVGELAITASDDARFAAVTNSHGRHGVVLDLARGEPTLPLDRGDYHPEVSEYPVAFARHGGALVVVHGTAWNRLDVSDPATGELRTVRESPRYERSRPAHYLDYFHGALRVSPSGEWIADDGWVWHPIGVVAVWSLSRWLGGNVWESEDGPSRAECGARGFWDAPMCWLDDRVLGIAGAPGADELEQSPPLLQRYLVDGGELLEPFACPLGAMVAEDGRLYVGSRDEGLSVLDLATGARLLHAKHLTPTAYRGRGEMLTLLPDGAFQVIRVG